MAKVMRTQQDLPDVARLLSLSDGVVAIALTLLVLNLHVPDLPAHQGDSWSALWHALSDDGPVFTSYVVSFYVIAQFWLAHHRVFRMVAGHDEGLAWWNFAFLFTITIMPFTSAMLGEYGNNPLAVDLFALNLLLASLSTQLVMIFARRRHLLVAGLDPEVMRSARVRSLGIMVVVSVSMAVAWEDTSWAKYIWILLILVPRGASRLGGGSGRSLGFLARFAGPGKAAHPRPPRTVAGPGPGTEPPDGHG
ncbi:MAG: TMEM175 family protein [Acidimicrobiales bacterium]